MWQNAAHACNGVKNSTEQILLFKQSLFCLQPPGDTATRKGLFDGLIAGCIPVIFTKATLHYYAWFLNETEAEAVSVHIPLQKITSQEIHFVDYLKSISPETIAQKQKSIFDVAAKLQYSLVPPSVSRMVNTSRDFATTSVHALTTSTIYEPPFPDAASIIINRILDQATIEPIEGFSEEELRKQKCMQHELIKSHPDYGGIFKGGTKHLAYAGGFFKKHPCNISMDEIQAYKFTTGISYT